MRTAAVTACLLALAAMAPGAEAAETRLMLTPDDHPTVLENGTTFNVTLRMEMRDFACFEEHTFIVFFTANATENVLVEPTNLTLLVEVPSGTYHIEPFLAEGVMPLTVFPRAPGPADVHLEARFEAHPAGDDCVADGGFPAAVANETLSFEVPPDDEASAVEPEAPTPANATDEDTPAANGTCATPSCGYIAEYTGGGEESTLDVPALPLLGLLGAVGAAVALRRRG